MARRQGTDNSHAAPYWAADLHTVLQATGAHHNGLPPQEAAQRLQHHGPNQIGGEHRHHDLRLLAKQFTSPIILILSAATVLSIAVGDATDGVIILLIIAASGLLGFWQERSAGHAVDALQQRVQVRIDVRRDGHETSVPATDIVTGDLVVLRPGDVVPADCRVTESHELQVDQAALTGEPFPVGKKPDPVPADTPLAARASALYMGTHVVSGHGTAVVVHTGNATEFAAVSARTGDKHAPTGFERGLTGYGFLLVKLMAVLVTAIFIVNLTLARPLVESLLFSLALAVGLTPQMLPAIVAVSLSAGARQMAQRRVIVKRLDAIEDLGGMSVLLIDKTGTVTAGVVRLNAALDIDGTDSDEILRLARLNAGLQHGFHNPMDQAIMAETPPTDPRLRLDEVPYDFTRKRLSVLVNQDGTPVLVTKGAFNAVLAVCDTARHPGGEVVPLDAVRPALQQRFAQLSADGFRILAVATRELPGRAHVTDADEAQLTLVGLLAFHDPPKPTAAQAIGDLAQLGISVRLVTGDNRLAAGHVARQVGLAGDVLVGHDIDQLTDAELARRVATVAVFAEVEPLHKERVVQAIRTAGAVVGFLGDGINDTPGLHAADVGISVDSAVDVAKQSAAVVLLEKDLCVIADSIRLGRRTFTNTLKYVRVNTSAAFGNVVSMSAASAFLPFLPLLPRQILLLNFLSDVPYTTISTDNADPEQIQRPRVWKVRMIRNFMLVFGSISVAFDLLTYLVLRHVLGTGTAVFRTGWFVEFTVTEIAVLMVLRTNRLSVRSRPGRPMLITSAALAAVTLALPYTPLAGPLGLAPLGSAVLGALAVLTVVYVLTIEVVKRFFPPDR